MENSMKKVIVLGSDHAGFKLKEFIKDYLTKSNNYQIIDVGTKSSESCDFPDYAFKLCEEMLKHKDSKGIVTCGSGIGVSICANKVKGIRCALVHDYLGAKLAREHTDCNVLAMGENFIGQVQATLIVDTFLSTESLKEEKYIKRIDKITEMERKI